MPLPAASLQGDVELQLESGEALRVHSLLLELASSVLSDALKVARDAHSAPDPLQPVRLPLPSTTVKEARILLLVRARTSLCRMSAQQGQQQLLSLLVAS